jgi:hypothetical protein
MKKQLFVIMAAASALVLAGCGLFKTKPDVENPNPVEPTSQVVTVKPSENPNDYEGPGDEFPGGLDDDGRGSEEDAAYIELKTENDAENAMVQAFITGYDDDGKVLWTYETKKDYIGQCDSFKEIGVMSHQYIFVAWGEVISLDPATGGVNWVNSDFQGYGVSVTTDYEGDTLYMSGYFGPDLFVMDLNGKTINRINVNNDEYYWPYELTWENEHAVKVKFESNEKELTLDPLGDPVQ